MYNRILDEMFLIIILLSVLICLVGCSKIEINNKNYEVTTIIKEDSNGIVDSIETNEVTAEVKEIKTEKEVYKKGDYIDENGLRITISNIVEDTNTEIEYKGVLNNITKAYKISFEVINETEEDIDEINYYISSKVAIKGYDINNQGIDVKLLGINEDCVLLKGERTKVYLTILTSLYWDKLNVDVGNNKFELLKEDLMQIDKNNVTLTGTKNKITNIENVEYSVVRCVKLNKLEDYGLIEGDGKSVLRLKIRVKNNREDDIDLSFFLAELDMSVTIIGDTERSVQGLKTHKLGLIKSKEINEGFIDVAVPNGWNSLYLVYTPEYTETKQEIKWTIYPEDVENIEEENVEIKEGKVGEIKRTKYVLCTLENVMRKTQTDISDGNIIQFSFLFKNISEIDLNETSLYTDMYCEVEYEDGTQEFISDIGSVTKGSFKNKGKVEYLITYSLPNTWTRICFYYKPSYGEGNEEIVFSFDWKDVKANVG